MIQYSDQENAEIQEVKKSGKFCKLSFVLSVASIVFFSIMMLSVLIFYPGKIQIFRMILIFWSFAANCGAAAVVTGIVSGILGKKRYSTINHSIAGITIGAISLVASLVLFIIII